MDETTNGLQRAAADDVPGWVPEEVSIVAIGPDEAVAVQTSPRLTTIPVPALELGRHAVEMLLGPAAGESGVTLLPPRLDVRESTAVAPVAGG